MNLIDTRDFLFHFAKTRTHCHNFPTCCRYYKFSLFFRMATKLLRLFNDKKKINKEDQGQFYCELQSFETYCYITKMFFVL